MKTQLEKVFMRNFKWYIIVFSAALFVVYIYYELRSVQWFSDTGTSGWVQAANSSRLAFRIPPPEITDATKVIVFNHGTQASGIKHDCNKIVLPDSIKELMKLGVEVYIPCSQATEPFLSALLPWLYRQHAFMRADELKSELDKLILGGAKPVNIFLSGQSQGGWIPLLAAARYPEKFNSLIVFAPGPGLGKMKYDFFSRREMNRQRHYNEVLKAKRIKGLIFYYENDSYGKPEELLFLQKKYEPDLSLISYGCNITEGHFTAYYDCRLPETIKMIRDIIGV